MKSKTPPFEELINRLVICIQKREPEKVIGDIGKGILSAQWKSKPKELHKMVKLLEIQEFKQKLVDESFDERVIEFQIGVDVLGNPITCIHKIIFKREFEQQKKNYVQSNYALGRKQSQEQIEKRKETMRENGYRCSEQTKEKISIANTGRKFMEDHKYKLSISSKKSIFIYDIENKKIIESCVNDFSLSLKIYPNAITDRFKRYPNRIYKKRWVLSKDIEELKRLMNQLNIL